MSAASDEAERRRGEHRQLDEAGEEVGDRRGDLAQRALAAELLGRRARVVQREQRVAGDHVVGRRPHDRADRRERGVAEALRPGRRPRHPQEVQAGEQPRLRAQQARAREQDPHRPAAPGALALEHRRPEDQRHVGHVDVPAGGEEGEVEAGEQQRRRDHPDERREGELAEPVDPPHHAAGSTRTSCRPTRGRRTPPAGSAARRRRSRADARSAPGSPRTPAWCRRAPPAPTAASSRSRSSDTSGRRRTRSRSRGTAARTRCGRPCASRAPAGGRPDRSAGAAG